LMPVTIHLASEVDPDLQISNFWVLNFERKSKSELDELLMKSYKNISEVFLVGYKTKIAKY
jgi:hypothetical protein